MFYIQQKKKMGRNKQERERNRSVLSHPAGVQEWTQPHQSSRPARSAWAPKRVSSSFFFLGSCTLNTLLIAFGVDLPTGREER